MADNTKLLGVLTQDGTKAQKTIKDVNDALKTLGKGVNLDLSNIVSSKVNSRLSELKKQIDEVSKAATKMKAPELSQIKEATQKLQEYYKARAELFKATDTRDVDRISEKIKQLETDMGKYSDAVKSQAENTKAVLKAQEAYEKTVAETNKKTSQEVLKTKEETAKKEEELINKQTQMQLSALEMQAQKAREYGQQKEQELQKYIELEQRAAEEQRKTQEAQAKYNVDALNQQRADREAYIQWWEQALAQQDKNVAAAYKEILELGKQINSDSTGYNTKNVLAKSLQEKMKAYEQYTKEAKDAALQDEEVLKLQQQIEQEAARQADILAGRAGEWVVRKVGQFSLSMIRDYWNGAIEYASSYYDKLNEIRTIAGKTEEEANRMGKNLRKMAKEMSVTSTELSQAAVTFYRQGLSDAEVNKRLEWVTKYAKLAKIDFESAAEQITASSNAMSKDIQGDVQRVVDVFLYLGDSAATSGEEIGKAMQKASASATEFGLSFEWLGSYIATVSEQTRQAPESIGNAFNSMMARMHSIKQKGFNEEDATKINDVAKALKNINVELLDSDGNWRKMSDIYSEIASQWDKLDGKTKSYLATVMAGTRQQNVFFALMNDMSKGIEGGSRAWELYTGAMNAAGTASQKYAVYEESITAAQDRMKASLEELYSVMQAGPIKDFYNVLSWVIDGLANLGESGLIISAAVGGIMAIIFAVKKFNGAMNLLNSVLSSTASAFMKHPLFAGAAIAVTVAGLLGVFGGLAGEIETTAERYEKATKKIEESSEAINKLDGAQRTNIKTFAELSSKTKQTTTEQANLKKTMDELSTISYGAKRAIDQFKDGEAEAAETAKELNKQLEAQLENQKKILAFNAGEAIKNMDTSPLVVKNDTYHGITSKGLEELFDMQKPYLKEGEAASWENWVKYYETFMEEVTEEAWREFSASSAGKLQRILVHQEGIQGANNPEEIGQSVENALAAYEDSVKKIKEQAQARLNEQLNNAILSAKVELDPVQKEQLQEKMEKELLSFADDGEFTSYEWGKARDWFQNLVSDLIKDSMNVDNGEGSVYDSEDILKHITKKMLGEDALAEMGTLIEEYGKDSDFVDAVERAYSEMIEAGLSEVDIQKIFKNIPLEDWADINLSRVLADMMGETDFSEIFSWEDADGNIEELSADAKGLMYSLLNAGVAADKLKAALNGTESEEVYIEKLEKIKKAYEEQGSNDDTGNVIDEKTLQSIVEKQEEYKKLMQLWGDLKSGKQIYYEDLKDFQDTHAELIALHNDAEKFEEALSSAISKTVVDLDQQTKDFVLNNKKIFESYAQDYSDVEGINTFQELIDYYKTNNQNKDFIDVSRKVSVIVNQLVNYVSAAKKAEEQTEGFAKALEDLAKVNDAKEALEILKNPEGKGLDKIEKAYKTLKAIYPELENADPSTLITVATQKTEELEASAIAAAESFGEMGKAAVESMREAKKETSQFKGDLEQLRQTAEYVVANGSKDSIGAFMQKNYQLGNVDLQNRPKVIDKGNYETIKSEEFYLGKGFLTSGENGENEMDFDYKANAILHITPITPDGKKLTEEELEKYIREVLLPADDILEADKIENGGRGLVLWLQEVVGDFDEAKLRAGEFDDLLHLLQEAYYGDATLEGFAAKAAKEIEQAIASANNYQGQLEQLMIALNAGGIDDVLNKWNLIDPKIQEAITNKFPQLTVALQKAKKAEEDFGKGSVQASAATRELARVMDNAIGLNTSKYFKNTEKAIDGLSNGTMRAADAYDAMRKEAETAIKAQVEFDTATKNMRKGVEVSTNEISNLASLLGVDAQWMLDNWGQVGPMLQQAADEGQDAFRRLNEAAFIQITGNADVDFSDLEKGLVTINGLAEETVQRLLDTGQFTLEEIPLNTDAWIFQDGKWIKERLTGMQQVLKPTGENPLNKKTSYKPKTSSSNRTTTPRTSSGGGSSGGSGNNSSSASSSQSEIEMMLDAMAQVQKLYEYQRNMFQTEQNYYQQTGELQGVILYLKKEGEVLLGQNKVLEENVAQIEKLMATKREELNSLSQSSEEYEQAASDLKNLQDRHQEYTKQLIDNRTQIDKLNKSIKDQNDAIRNMEIDLRNTILQAIKDREALNDRMLQGTITTENTIMELIQKRYEKERDLILESTQKQIDALKEERDLLSEQLQLRKEQADMQDKAAKLADLEAKYARIVADPTRRNEALNIQDQIAKLRDEMGWESAERELKASQQSIDNQVSSLEDYVEYVQNWYNQLFEHPQKLVEEMQSIIVLADEDILSWLQANSDEFADATAASQQNMINGWTEMLMNMHGEIKTYWDEVEQIIAGGDEAVIQFLVENSADYREAGKLQAQAYVDQWMEKLNKLALAHKQVAESMIYNNYAVIQSMSGGRSSSGLSSGSTYTGGGSSSGSSSSDSKTNKNTSSQKKTSGYTAEFNGTVGKGKTKDAAYNALYNQLGRTLQDYIWQSPSAVSYATFLHGGEANFTGPAWLDGTKTRPERILDAEQTELFNTMVKSLESIAKIRIPSMPAFDGDFKMGSGGVNVGDIILNIDKLEDDSDYNEIAEKVLDVIMERMNRGSVIGGIRF